MFYCMLIWFYICNSLLKFTCCEIKFIYSEKATKFCKITTLLSTGTTKDKSKVEISQNFVVFQEYMKFNFLTKFGNSGHSTFCNAIFLPPGVHLASVRSKTSAALAVL